MLSSRKLVKIFHQIVLTCLFFLKMSWFLSPRNQHNQHFHWRISKVFSKGKGACYLMEILHWLRTERKPYWLVSFTCNHFLSQDKLRNIFLQFYLSTIFYSMWNDLSANICNKWCYELLLISWFTSVDINGDICSTMFFFMKIDLTCIYAWVCPWQQWCCFFYVFIFTSMTYFTVNNCTATISF